LFLSQKKIIMSQWYDDDNCTIFTKKNMRGKKQLNCQIVLLLLLLFIIFSIYIIYDITYNLHTHHVKTHTPFVEKRYQLQFSAKNVRPTTGEGNAFGYGYIQFSNHTTNARVCWSFTAIGINRYITDMAIHGPLTGNEQLAISADVYIPLIAESFTSDGHVGCVSVNSAASINAIYFNPSKFYVLCNTEAHPVGAMWSNLNAQWDVAESITFKNITQL